MDERAALLQAWAVDTLCALGLIEQGREIALVPVSGDASFRRYFRACDSERSWICVDAPPDKEDSSPFIAIARSWGAAGINVPKVLAADLVQGVMLLSDFGDNLYLPALNQASANDLYQRAFDELIKIQPVTDIQSYQLPHYDNNRLLDEMRLCPDWFLTRQLGLELSSNEQAMLNQVFGLLIASALEQPQVCVHRDYHSRNLMLTDTDAPGVLDFQDAVLGPVTYDLVSLLRDCYIDWPQAGIDKWVKDFRQMLPANTVESTPDTAQFMRWFDLMGMQRHIKCVGIFSRLNIRDGKSGYLNDIPRTFNYILDVSTRYDEFALFNTWLQEKVVPAMARAGIRS